MSRNVRPPRIFAGVLIVIGLALAIGGIQLAMLGGSLYYLLAGACLVVCAVLLWRGDRRGAWLYGGFLAFTIAWSLYEVGFDAWALAPRLVMFSVLGCWLLVPSTRRALNGGADVASLLSLRSARMAAAALAGLLIVGIWQNRSPVPASIERTAHEPGRQGEWPHYGRAQSGTRYASFGDITPDNVKQLKVAWTYRTGVGGAFKATPIQVGDALYVCAAGNVMIALDATSGTERWRYDPKVNTKSIGFSTTCRGVTYYKSPQPFAQCNERILTATTDARMFAVDAADGKPCADFGAHENKVGEISLLPGMGEVKPGFYYVTSPPTIARNVAVLGGWVVDNVMTGEPSGVIRAFDPITGQLKWAWDAGKATHATLAEGETYTRGTPNSWSIFSADDELGLIYLPMGNATPDYFGAHRKPELEKYASSIVALDVTTGDVRWHYQTTHHDIWDYDVPSQPVLTNVVSKNDVNTPAVIVPTKRGELFVFDRRDGTPLADIEERGPMPKSDVPEEWTSDTQPFSVGMPSFAGAPLTEADTWGLTPIDQLLCRIEFKRLRYDGPFTPPSVRGSLEYPGLAGGMNWGSVTVHEDAQLLVVQALHMANRVRLVPRADAPKDMPTALGGPQIGTPYLANSFPWLSPIFVPCQRPPYGQMAVVDLKTLKTVWQRPLGTANELGPLGLKLKLPLPLGVFFSGGNIVTQSGLIFVGGTMDRYFRAIDVYTGKELWRDYLPEQAQATPMSYVDKNTQKQFVVIAVPDNSGIDLEHGDGADGSLKQASGGYLIAYSL
jgi:membrane-bound PQQ-dependent dehydrogenase (glucose/quinate/shikimate family)